MCKLVIGVLAMCGAVCVAADAKGAERAERLRVRVTWGHEARSADAYHVKLVPASAKVAIENVEGLALEEGEGLRDGVCRGRAGGGDVDGVEVVLRYSQDEPTPVHKLHSIWEVLLRDSDADVKRRLLEDPALQMDPPLLRVQMNAEGRRGFAVGIDQLLRNRAMWVPGLDVYLAAGEQAVSFADHKRELEQYRGRRVLDQVHAEAEATYEQYTARWADMGNPKHEHPSHIVGLTWDSAIAKFGVDRRAGVTPDFGNPDRFGFTWELGGAAWKSQSLSDGLPVMITTFEKEGVRYIIEQFAYPLEGPPAERRGDIPMVLLQKVTATNLSNELRKASVGMVHTRELSARPGAGVAVQSTQSVTTVEETASQRSLLTLQGPGRVEHSAEAKEIRAKENEPRRVHVRVRMGVGLELKAGASESWVINLPSAPVEKGKQKQLAGLDYPDARAKTVQFWEGWLARGAQFRVPEQAVNELFRANLWHALRLPRRHGVGPGVKIDLPYSNFAYDQNGTPWPINQAVYVDYMLYDLRGHHDVSAEELEVMYGNQEGNGRVGGYANWVVYTPGMMYAVAKHYLLTHDKASFERLLPQTLKAMDWCIAEARRSSQQTDGSAGLVRGPLNDLTGDGVWAFSQAYIYAGLSLLGDALEEAKHPRAAECRAAALQVRQAIIQAFSQAAARSPLVLLRDGTWSPYVPCEVLTPRRMFEQWYPTDVDTGAMHLLRLKALPTEGLLAESLLHDHEDNLYLKNWGMANEPVYNPQATAYLLRDDPKAAIRAFYSYMACAFSHSVYEPVEHRWGWGQYFGPPSTDGAWFELYRNMLIHELDDGTLLLGQATPRVWLEEGKQIQVQRAPTYYGPISMEIRSQSASGRISAELTLSDRRLPRQILLRLRHPQGKAIRSVQVNGQAWSEFDAGKEWVRIESPRPGKYSIVVSY